MGLSQRRQKAFNVVFGMVFTALVSGLGLIQADALNGAKVEVAPKVATQNPVASKETPVDVETKTGEEVTVPPTQVLKVTNELSEVSDDEFFASLANAFGQSKGASALALIALVVQLLIQFTKTRLFGQLFRKVDARGKLSIVLVLTSVTTFLGLMSQGMGWVAAATSGAFMSSAMVAGHQVFKLFVKKDPNAAV